jgi:ABC-2 type transport system permease protein
LRTTPTPFYMVMLAKAWVYLAAAAAQAALIFAMGIYLMPALGLDKLELPASWAALAAALAACAAAAVSYALMLGSLAKTQEQANSIGASSVIIFAALGGIWVPSFAMPAYMQMAAQISPLHWALSGISSVFLTENPWARLPADAASLSLFCIICLAGCYWGLLRDKILESPWHKAKLAPD